MPATGFHFIQMFFVSANIDSNNVLRQSKQKKTKKKKNSGFGGNMYSSLWDEPAEKEEDASEDKDKETPYFLVMDDPSDLQHLDMIWSIVLESEVEEVYTDAIHLLVYSYLSIESTNTSEEKRSAYLQALLNKCFELIKPEGNPSAQIVSRMTMVLKEAIRQSEKSGTVGVRPHRSILKGELLDRVMIKYMS